MCASASASVRMRPRDMGERERVEGWDRRMKQTARVCERVRVRVLTCVCACVCVYATLLLQRAGSPVARQKNVCVRMCVSVCVCVCVRACLVWLAWARLRALDDCWLESYSVFFRKAGRLCQLRLRLQRAWPSTQRRQLHGPMLERLRRLCAPGSPTPLALPMAAPRRRRRRKSWRLALGVCNTSGFLGSMNCALRWPRFACSYTTCHLIGGRHASHERLRARQSFHSYCFHSVCLSIEYFRGCLRAPISIRA